MSDETHESNHGHPSNATYVLIGAILTVITLIEVGVFYIEAFAPILAPILIVLSAGKFVLVVGYYMHLKPDNKIFALIFGVPFVLATIVLISIMFLVGPWGSG